MIATAKLINNYIILRNMEMIAKVSKGSIMDQIYLPKNRIGLNIGDHVIIRSIQIKKKVKRPYFYNIEFIEPIKLEIIREIFSAIDDIIDKCNIVITGSFLDKGFNFRDIDIILITEEKIDGNMLEKLIENKIKIENHIIIFDKKNLTEALSIDPIWRIMISKSVSNQRIPPLPRAKLNYRYLDAQMIKSNLLINNFDSLTGKEKYKLTRNLMAIYLFTRNISLSKKRIDGEIERKFDIEIDNLKCNLVDDNFLKKYKTFYYKFEKELIKNAAEQEKTN